MTRRAVQFLFRGHVGELRLDPNVSVHSLRVTALARARERGSDIIDLEGFAGHAGPRTTLTCIKSRDRLSKSPACVLWKCTPHGLPLVQHESARGAAGRLRGHPLFGVGAWLGGPDSTASREKIPAPTTTRNAHASSIVRSRRAW